MYKKNFIFQRTKNVPRRATRTTKQSGNLEDEEGEDERDPLALSGDDSNTATGRGRKRRSNDGAESSERYAGL